MNVSRRGIRAQAGELVDQLRLWLRVVRARARGLVDGLRRWFRDRGEYEELRRLLVQSQNPVPYDLYLARTTIYAGLGAAVGAGIGVMLAAMVAASDVPVVLTLPAIFADLADPLLDAALVLAGAALGGGSVAAVRLLGPAYRARIRGRQIDLALPHAVVFMHALSYGGANIVEVFEALADADDAYGEVAHEIEQVTRDVRLFGEEFKMAVNDLYTVTPSHNMRLFLDDLLGVIEAGGDVTMFLEERSRQALKRAESEQKDFLETLSVLSEIYTTMFVAAPLLLVVVLLVIGLTGGETLTALYVIVYLGLPAGILGFLVLLDALDATLEPSASIETSEGDDGGSESVDDERYATFARRRRRADVGRELRHLPAAIRRRPALTLGVTVPLVAIGLGASVVFGGADPGAVLAEPVSTTTVFVAVPLLVVMTPLALFHWLQRRRRGAILRQFPEKLTSLANSNEMGLTLTESIQRIGRQSRGELAREFHKVSNDITWNDDPGRALTSFANSLAIPQISQTVKLITESRASTGTLYKTLNIATTDAHARKNLRHQRIRQLSQHVAIIIIGFLVYLFVLLMLEYMYITPLVARAQALEGLAESGVPLGVTDLPVEEYRMLFYHSVLIQGVGNGLIAGKMTRNDAVAGLRYSIAFVVIAAVTFTVLVG